VRVLFVSKPVVPPWHDGSKNLVRDLAMHLERAVPTVLVGPGAVPLGPRVHMDVVYRDAGRFAPGVAANARVLARLLGGDPEDAWHFVFAPNPASSGAAVVARTAVRARGWRGKIVQTVASAPARFEGASRLLFGDVVVCLSEHTRERLVHHGADASRLRVIPPCAPAPREVGADEIARLRSELRVGDAPLVVYPGDYEVSRGARTVADAVPALLRAVPEARVVFACRPKTARAVEARRAVEAALGKHAEYTRHAGTVSDMAVLLAAADVVAFPVDELYGKVDVPLVVLEALAMGRPLVLARGGPLEEVPTAAFVDPGDSEGLAQACVSALRGDEAPRAGAASGRDLWARRFSPRVVAAAHDALYEELD
jgi:glycosyltransferase involved in cell wall biosynthesis